MSRRQITAVGPQGRFTVAGQEAKALLALVSAGSDGRTALEVASWAYRFGAYVWKLRHRYGLAIETRRELHEGGWHARYVLASPVTIAPGEQAEPERRAA
ncbi:MAG: hypothetical protein V4513_03990 [Pseudomonadota bacterium]